MLIIDYHRLNQAEALANENHPMHVYAQEYKAGVEKLRKLYPEGAITLKRSGFPKLVDGITAKGKEVRNIPEPVSPIQVSLLANYDDPIRGREHWGCCTGTPKPMEGGLWDIGNKRRVTIAESLRVDLQKDIDLAFFLYFKSKLVIGKHLVIDDPRETAKQKGDRERAQLKLKTAIWETLSDDTQLRKVAQGYGVTLVDKKQPDEIRIELEGLLRANDEKKKRDPMVRGTQEFLEDLKITDYIRLSSFLRKMLDESYIKWSLDGKYKVGDKVIAHIPSSETNRKFEWLCGYFSAPNNADRLRDLMKDLINRAYLDEVKDPKDFRWLAKVMDIEGYYNKPESQVREMVYNEFGIATKSKEAVSGSSADK